MKQKPFRYPDDYFYEPYRGKYLAIGGTVVCDTEEAAIKIEEEHYKDEIKAKDAEPEADKPADSDSNK